MVTSERDREAKVHGGGKVFDVTLTRWAEGVKKPNQHFGSIKWPPGSNAVVYTWYTGASPTTPDVPIRRFRSLLASVRSLRGTGYEGPIIVVQFDLRQDWAQLLRQAGANEVRGIELHEIPIKRIRSAFPPGGVANLGCQSSSAASRCRRTCKARLIRIAALGFVMDFDTVLLTDLDILFLHDPSVLWTHRQPAVSIASNTFNVEALGHSTTAELLREQSLRRAPDAGPWIWANGTYPGTDWEHADELAGVKGRLLNSGAVLIKPSGNVVASLLALTTRHAKHICSATTIFAGALQTLGATEGIRYHRSRQGEQCTASSFCGPKSALKAFQLHCMFLRMPSLRKLHRSVMLIGPWTGLDPAVIRSRRKAAIQQKYDKRQLASPMMLHRCCQERSGHIAKEEEAWEEELLAFSTEVPNLSAPGQEPLAIPPPASPAGSIPGEEKKEKHHHHHHHHDKPARRTPRPAYY